MSSNNVIAAIPAFIGGVSQQSPALRLRTQCDLMDNAHATIADGLMQRPNADLIAILGAITEGGSTGYAIHKIDRDITEKYIVVFTTDATNPIRVFDLTGSEMDMRYGYYNAAGTFVPDATKKQYITDGGITDVRKQIKACSIADYTIVVNTEKTTAADDALTDAKEDAAFVYVKGCHKGKYKITYKWKESSVDQSAVSQVTPTYVDGVLNYDADMLLNYFIDNNPNAADLVITGNNSVLKVVGTVSVDEGTIHVDVSDPFGGTDLVPINYCTVDGIDKLPPRMPGDVIIKVGGDNEIQQDDYYMLHTYETKIWTETLGWEIKYALNSLTLPHRLMRTDVDEFTFAPIIWDDRTVGDDNTNFMPAFIGEKVSNVVFAKNRLEFLSKENIVCSRASDYFNFFSSTVMDVIDDDPIDVAQTGQQVTKMRSGIGFDNGLLLFADEEQFALTSGEQLLTPKTVSIDATTAYPADPYSEPIKLGADVYFASPKDAYLSVREYTIMPETLMKDAYDVTSHVPKYIPNGDVLLSGCNSLDMLFLWSSTTPKYLYVHKFLWDGDKKVQQAWYRWTFTDDIKGFVTFGTVLYILFYDATNDFRLESMKLENIPFTGQDFRYNLDSLMKLTGGAYTDLVTNGGFDTVTTGWTPSGSTLASIAGGQSGNCLEITNAGDAVGSASQEITTVIGYTYEVIVYFEKGTGSTGRILIKETGGATYKDWTELADVAWTAYSHTFVATSVSTTIEVFCNEATTSKTALFDTISLYRQATTFTLPMDVDDGTGWTVINATTNVELSTGFTLADTTLTITGDVSSTDFFVGRDYTATYRFSEWYIRDDKDGALIAGDLIIRNLILSFEDTGYFRIEVTPFQRDTNTEVMTETMTGVRVDESIIGEVVLLSGEETFMIMANSRRTTIDLITDSYLPMAIQVGAWQGTFVIKGKIK